MTLEIKRRQRLEVEPRIKWWKLKKLCRVQGGVKALGGSEELVREIVRRVFVVSSGQSMEDKVAE